jgi:hypothetical protein
MDLIGARVSSLLIFWHIIRALCYRHRTYWTIGYRRYASMKISIHAQRSAHLARPYFKMRGQKRKYRLPMLALANKLAGHP